MRLFSCDFLVNKDIFLAFSMNIPSSLWPQNKNLFWIFFTLNNHSWIIWYHNKIVLKNGKFCHQSLGLDLWRLTVIFFGRNISCIRVKLKIGYLPLVWDILSPLFHSTPYSGKDGISHTPERYLRSSIWTPVITY